MKEQIPMGLHYTKHLTLKKIAQISLTCKKIYSAEMEKYKYTTCSQVGIQENSLD